MEIEIYTNRLYKHLVKHGDAQIAKEQSAYMRNQFPFLGLKSPVLRAAADAYFKESGPVGKNEVMHFALACANYPEREMFNIAIDVLHKYSKHLEEKHIHDIKTLIIQGAWWDTTDGIAPNVVAKLVTQYPNLLSLMDEWIEDENMWIRRSAILYALKFKKKTDWERLQTYILMRAHEKEFFIQKAIGWVLREYSKTNPDEVIQFIQNNPLAPLSKREGLKWLKNKGLHT